MRVTVEVLDFPAYLRLCMEVDGFKGGPLAACCGVTHASVSHWRKGRAKPEAMHVPRIADALPSMDLGAAMHLWRQPASRLVEVTP